MELQLQEIDQKTTPIISAVKFRKEYAGNISFQAVDYAMKHDLIDYVIIGDRRSIVLNTKTRAYTPNASPKRDGGKDS